MLRFCFGLSRLNLHKATLPLNQEETIYYFLIKLHHQCQHDTTCMKNTESFGVFLFSLTGLTLLKEFLWLVLINFQWHFMLEFKSITFPVYSVTLNFLMNVLHIFKYAPQPLWRHKDFPWVWQFARFIAFFSNCTDNGVSAPIWLQFLFSLYLCKCLFGYYRFRFDCLPSCF